MNQTRKVTYLYRDAGNYKYWGEFHIFGDLSLADLSPHLLHGEFFVPERIGIPSLVPETQNDDDHILHEFDRIELCEPAICVFTADELANRIREANNNGWF